MHPDASAGAQQFGQLVGEWSCAGHNRQQDGSWKANTENAEWDWYWILDGQAVQDIWRGQPATNPAGLGMNIRMYDADADSGKIAWSTTGQVRWDLIAPNGSRPLRPPHQAAW